MKKYNNKKYCHILYPQVFVILHLLYFYNYFTWKKILKMKNHRLIGNNFMTT